MPQKYAIEKPNKSSTGKHFDSPKRTRSSSKLSILEINQANIYKAMLEEEESNTPASFISKSSSSLEGKPLPIKAIAFYLPQYHPIPENDLWWGEIDYTNPDSSHMVFSYPKINEWSEVAHL